MVYPIGFCIFFLFGCRATGIAGTLFALSSRVAGDGFVAQILRFEGYYNDHCHLKSIITEKMKISYMTLWIVAMTALTGCGSTMRIYSDLDPSGNFDTYSSYSFLEFTEGNQKTIPGMELERIRVAMARELEKRGLEYVEENGDVSVQVTVYHRQAVDGYYRYYRRYVYMERAIALDMYDNQTQKHVWHCAAVDELVYDPEERAGNLPEVAARIFEKYPVQPATAP